MEFLVEQETSSSLDEKDGRFKYRRVAKSQITNEEHNGLLQTQQILEEIRKRERLMLLGLVVADKIINEEALKKMNIF